MVRARVSVALAALVIAAACGDNGATTEVGWDAWPLPDPVRPAVTEAAECGGAPLTARGGAPLALRFARVLPVLESLDIDSFGGRTIFDNLLSSFAPFVDEELWIQLGFGHLAVPIELFDRGPDPDGCVKLALYQGACAEPPCDFTDFIPDRVSIDPGSIADGAPISRLRALHTGPAGELSLDGPGYLELFLPFEILDSVPRRLPVPLTVIALTGTLAPPQAGPGIDQLRAAGVIQAFRAGQVRASPVPELGVFEGDTALDMYFASDLGRDYLGLNNFQSCLRAELDFDQDGQELFCDTRIDGVYRVDTCIDGDGVAIHDGDNGVADCSQAMKHGLPRFPDGITAQVELWALPALLAP